MLGSYCAQGNAYRLGVRSIVSLNAVVDDVFGGTTEETCGENSSGCHRETDRFNVTPRAGLLHIAASCRRSTDDKNAATADMGKTAIEIQLQLPQPREK